jgi:putative IMPACT (imprinted ancient) family translation regulator
VVVRWFGGVKLGAGGLIRAYGGCAAECLRQASKRAIVATCRLRIDCDFAAAANLQNQLAAYAAEKIAEEFHPGGVTLTIGLPLAQRERFVEHVRDHTRGEARIDAVEGD